MTRTARVVLHGDPKTARETWMLLHGYAQSASEMLEACSALASDERLLVAPEALSRFYRRGSSGPVGASWMTREAREHEIADCIAYLDRVAQWCELESGARGLPLNALGFSQGAATLWRWAARGAGALTTLVAWGSGVPPDLDLGAAHDRLARTKLVCVRGRRDPYFTSDWLAKDLVRAREARFEFEALEFDGGHELQSELLRDACRSGAGDGQRRDP